jgi:hypothetical protein
LPLAPYQDDPIGFAREVLGVEPWLRQRDILRAVQQYDRVAVRSGHKVGKSNSAAILTLWWLSTRPRGRVVLTSTTARQVNVILWSEVKRLHARAQARIGGEIHQLANSGLVLDRERYAFGFTADRPEAMAGISGDQLLYILDEASGISNPIFEAVEGNLAGGGKQVMFSNPTQTSGVFYEAFHTQRQAWQTLHIDSREAVGAGIPGLATQEWVDSYLSKYGPESPITQVRVFGNFPSSSDMTVIALGLVEAAKNRYDTTPRGETLRAGLDVARFGSDISVLVGVWGPRAEVLATYRQLDGYDLAGRVIRDLEGVAQGQPVRLNYDSAGVGASVEDFLKRNSPAWLTSSPVNSAEASPDEAYANTRAQGWFGLRDWLSAGGAIPALDKLEADLVTPTYSFDSRNRYLVESKDALKKRLGGRSTDYGDALWLATLNPPAQGHTATIPQTKPKLGRRW